MYTPYTNEISHLGPYPHNLTLEHPTAHSDSLTWLWCHISELGYYWTIRLYVCLDSQFAYFGFST